MQGTWVLSLGGEHPLGKEMATYSSIPVWRNPWTEEPGGLQPMGLQRVRHDWATKQQQQQGTRVQVLQLRKRSPSAFSKTSLNIWKITVHVLLKPGLENFEHYFTSMWDEYNCVVVWAFFGIAFLWDWNENWPFPVLWPLLSFPNLLAYWVQHFHSIIF